MKTNPLEAEKLLKDFLKNNPRTLETPEYVRHLLNLYQKRNASPSDFMTIAEFFLKNTDNHPDTVAFILACAKNIPDTSMKEKALRRLFERPDFSIPELNALLTHLPTLKLKSEFLNRYKKPFQNTPELCELYYLMTQTEIGLKNNEKALEYLNLLLSQKEVFRYADCMSMRIAINARLGQDEHVRKDCQSLLLTKLSASEKHRIVLQLAQSWERSGDRKKAIATAWTAVPLTAQTSDADVQQLLTLIIRNAKAIESPDDLKEALELQKI